MEKSKIALIILCVYLAIVGYKVTAYNDNVFEVQTWSLKKKKPMKIPGKLGDNDPKAPKKKGLKCRLEHVSGKTLNAKGEALASDIIVPCTECNQFIYKGGNECLSYEYDKELNERDNAEPIMGMCTPSKDAQAEQCPFKTKTKTFKDVFESLPINLVASVLPSTPI